MNFYVLKGGQQLGPYSEVQIRTGIDRGEFNPDDPAWTAGKASWQPLSALINLDVNRPPPLLNAELPSPQSAPQGTGTFEQPSVTVKHQEPASTDSAPHDPSKSVSSSGRRSCKQCGAPYNLFSLTHVWGSGLCRRCSKANPKPVQQPIYVRPVSTRHDALKVVRVTAIVYILLGLFNIVMSWMDLLDSVYLGCIMIVASLALWIWNSRIAAIILFLIPILGTAFLIIIGEGRALLDAGLWNALTVVQAALAWQAIVGAFKLHREFAATPLSLAKAE